MPDGSIVMRRQIARLRDLPGLVTRIAPAVARAIEGEIVAQTKRGVGPDGKAWEKTEDGHVPLQHVEKDLSVRAVGSVVVVRLDGVYARHDVGAVKGGKRRQIIPSGALTEPISRAIDKVATAEFTRAMGGQ
jgi:hypothetical protein